jgi:uncharacterized protein
MSLKSAIASMVILLSPGIVLAQFSNGLQIKADPSNRTITAGGNGRVSVDPEIAILHIGFETRPTDSKSAYADGARISNEIVSAIKQAGIPDAAIRSESQRLEPVDAKNHKFKLTQNWTVKTPPQKAGEILDVAINAGATDSGEIEWTVEDTHALEDQALEQAVSRARSDAELMAKATGDHIGKLLYMSNQLTFNSFGAAANYIGNMNSSVERSEMLAAPLAIEPRKVVRTATVYAVFAIE